MKLHNGIIEMNKFDIKTLTVVFMVAFLAACSPTVSAPTPTLTITVTLVPTSTPKPTQTLSPAPVWVTLGSPFASDCGDGLPRIWSNDAYNAPWKKDANCTVSDLMRPFV